MLHHKREIEASLVPRADISWRSFAVTLLWYHAAIAQTQPRARSQLLTDHAHPSTQQRQAGHADIMRCLIPSISTDGRAFAMVSRTLQRSHLRFSPPWRHGGGLLISNLRCIVHTPTPSLLRLPPAAADHRLNSPWPLPLPLSPSTNRHLRRPFCWRVGCGNYMCTVWSMLAYTV